MMFNDGLSQLIILIISLFVGFIVGIVENAVIGGFIQFFENFPCDNIPSDNWEQICNTNKTIAISGLIVIPIASTVGTYLGLGRRLRIF